MRDRGLGGTGLRRCLTVLLLMVVAATLSFGSDRALAQSADAPDPELEVDAWAVFGAIAESRWAPVLVDLRNEGRRRDLELRITVSGNAANFQVNVELPRGGEKRVPVMIPALGSLNDQRLRLAVLEGGEELLTREIVLAKADAGLAAVVSDAGDELEGVNGLVQNGGRVVVVRPADLPESALGWSSVDQVVLAGGAWSKLETPQQEALRQWVGLGGHLLVMGGAEATQFIGALPEAMRPAEVAGTRSVGQLRSLGLLDSGPGPRGSVTIAELDPRDGAVLPLPSHEGAPLAARAGYGDGSVTALAFDAAQGPFRQWGGMDEAWGTLRVDRPAGTAWTDPRPDAQLLSASVGMLPEFELPSMTWVMLLITLYIVMVGPLNYQVLKRRRRLDLAWVTIPALTLLATAGTYGMGYALHGGGIMVYELALVRAVPEAEVAHVYNYVSIFSPNPRAYAIDVEGAQIIPVSAPGLAEGRVTILQGRDGSVEGLDIAQWSMRGVMAEAVIPWEDHDMPELRLESDAIVGEISNVTGRDLEDAVLVVPGGVSRLGELSRRASEAVSVRYRPGSNVQVNPTSDSNALRAGMFAAKIGDHSAFSRMQRGSYSPHSVDIPALRRADAMLLGFSEEAALNVDVRGRRASRRTETLIAAHVPIALGGQASSLRFIDGQAVQRGGSSEAACGKAAAAFDYVDREAVFHFNLGSEGLMPPRVYLNIIQADSKVGGGDVDAERLREIVNFQVSAWDPEASSWLGFDLIQPFQTERIPRLMTRIDGRDEIRLRIQALPRGAERTSAVDVDVEAEDAEVENAEAEEAALEDANPEDAEHSQAIFEEIEDICWEPKLSIGNDEAAVSDRSSFPVSAAQPSGLGQTSGSTVLPIVQRGQTNQAAYP